MIRVLETMSRAFAIITFVSVIIATSAAVLCIVLIPFLNQTKSTYQFVLSSEGKLKWITQDGANEKLMVFSSSLNKTNNQLEEETATPCGSVSVAVKEYEELNSNKAECWSVEIRRKKSSQCSLNDTFQVKECLSMTTSSGDPVYWFGGAEMVTQRWPINNLKLPNPTVFLSSDLPQRHGNVLESYYLSSLGAAVYVPPDVPLYVSILSNNQICLESTYEPSGFQQRVGPAYTKPTTTNENDEELLNLDYRVCIGESITEVHRAMTDPAKGVIKRPSELPDIKMMQDPIWSTWARYKDSINQTIVEEFAQEILFYNFTNSQLEIDDGYESAYGNFVFDQNKFPDAKEMISKIHDMNFRVTTWVTPFVNLDSINYKDGRTLGYFVPDEDGSPSIVRWWRGRGSPIDFTNAKAVEWYEGILEGVKSSYGVDSFKFDAGETTYLPESGLQFAAEPKFNPGDYTTLYSKAAFKIGGTIAEMRSSWKTQDINIFMRIMDKGSTWDYARGFQTVIPTALTFSIIGYPFVLPDMIGGNAYVLGPNSTGLPERELYIRWIELGAFLPCMQFSVSPWQYDDQVVKIAQKYVKLHRTVVYEEVLRAANRYISGEMSLLVAPIWLHAEPNDEDAFQIYDEFMVGDRYLVAPIVEKGSTERDIYLPGSTSVQWRDKMKSECIEDLPQCIVTGGSWIYSYPVSLEEISWWEKIN